MKETTVRVGGLGSERGQRMSGKVALAGVLALGSGAVHTMAQQKQASVPDAQVESSVLQALAKNPTLAKEQISSTTVYGVVTLSGHVADEPTRALAEDVVARTAGVAKVVDELTLGSGAADGAVADGQGEAGASQAQVSNSQITQPETGQVLQSDGTYAPADSVAQASGPGPTDAGQQGVPTGQQQAPIERGEPDATTLPAQPAYGPGQPTQGGAVQQGQYGQPGQYGQQQGQSGQGQYAQQGQYGQPPYGPQGPYAQTGQYGPPQRYPGGPSAYGQPGTELGGQQAGARVTVPAGTVVWLRVNQPIDSRRSPIGSSFSGVLQQDVVVGGLVAIPRGASLQGTVVDASSAGALKGRAELGLQLSTLTMGGMSYPISSNLWSQAGGDKAVRTVNSALGLGALGAIIGGVAGGGAGAAIGAGAGGAAGLGVSAASSGGAVVVPPESVLTFRLAAPVEVSTVSQAELNRLAYNVPGTAYGPPRMVRRYPAYYPYGPGYYYPRYYRGYPY